MGQLLNATEIKPGMSFIVDGAAVTAKSIDISKTGKHGASKCRIEAEGILDGKKRIVTVPGHERFETPDVDKRRGQVMAVSGDNASVMDLESYETLDVPISEELKGNVKEGMQIEYWILMGQKVIKRTTGG